MLHLLPQYQKDKVIKEYRMRLAVVIVSALFFLTLVFIVSTLPTFMILLNQKNMQIQEKISASQVIDLGNSLESENGIEMWKSVDALVPVKGSLVPSRYIEAVDPKKEGVVVDGYTFVQTSSDTPVQAGVSGIAKTRELLAEYVKDLDTKFGGVKLPLSSLAKQSDIPFDFKFQIDDKKVYE